VETKTDTKYVGNLPKGFLSLNVRFWGHHVCLILYSFGDMPVCCLKYLRNVNCSGKLSSCATSFIVVLFCRNNFFACIIVIIAIHSDGVRFDAFLMIRVK
jgi:hypothetical protein